MKQQCTTLKTQEDLQWGQLAMHNKKNNTKTPKTYKKTIKTKINKKTKQSASKVWLKLNKKQAATKGKRVYGVWKRVKLSCYNLLSHIEIKEKIVL